MASILFESFGDCFHVGSPAFGPVQSLVFRRWATKASLNPSQPDANRWRRRPPCRPDRLPQDPHWAERMVSKVCAQQYA